MSELTDQDVTLRHWFHRWDDGVWVGGFALPIFRYTCRRCGRVRYRRFGL